MWCSGSEAYFLGGQRPLQLAGDHPQGRDRPGCLGIPPQRHLPPLRQAQERAAVKVINHLGDEVMKVFRVS